MLYVFQYRPLVAVLAALSLLCLIVVPLSAQNILVMPGMDLFMSLRFTPKPIPAFPGSPDNAPVRLPCVMADGSMSFAERSIPADITGPAYMRNCRLFTEIVKADEKQEIREAWEAVFGFDVWYPYYKEKEIEGWVRDKFKVSIFKLKGEVQFNSKGLTYTFKRIF